MPSTNNATSGNIFTSIQFFHVCIVTKFLRDNFCSDPDTSLMKTFSLTTRNGRYNNDPDASSMRTFSLSTHNGRFYRDPDTSSWEGQKTLAFIYSSWTLLKWSRHFFMRGTQDTCFYLLVMDAFKVIPTLLQWGHILCLLAMDAFTVIPTLLHERDTRHLLLSTRHGRFYRDPDTSSWEGQKTLAFIYSSWTLLKWSRHFFNEDIFFVYSQWTLLPWSRHFFMRGTQDTCFYLPVMDAFKVIPTLLQWGHFLCLLAMDAFKVIPTLLQWRHILCLLAMDAVKVIPTLLHERDTRHLLLSTRHGRFYRDPDTSSWEGQKTLAFIYSSWTLLKW